MSHAAAVANKELRSSLNSPIAYVFIALFAIASWAIFFYLEKFFARDEASMRSFFDWIPWLLWGLAPPLTMRLWSDERRLGTWEILATTPVRTSSLVLGKFFASLGLLALALLFTMSLPVVVEIYGDLDFGPVIGGYVGALLLGGALLALGLVCSSLVQDQFVALVLGWTLGLLTLLPGLPFWESFANRGVAEALRGFAFNARFESIARGLIDLRDVLFYVTVTAFFLVLNVAIVNWRRYSS